MLNTTLLWMMVIPVIATGITFYLLSTERFGSIRLGQNVIFCLIGLLISILITATGFYLGKGSKTSDVEIWNGEIVGKSRTHDSYKRPYDCNCRSVERCSGSGSSRSCRSDRVCDTCWEDRYTVTWSCQSNIGSWTIQHLDETRRSVYDTPDPSRYTIIREGDPVAKTNSYTNYIKAVPETLFRPAQDTLKAKYANKIPAYPIGIYDFYKVDRIVPVGVNIPNIREWNERLSNSLKKLGPLKQANAVIVVTNISDPNYFYALQDAWLNGKKNDIVVVIGAPEFPKKAAWVNIMSMAQDSIFNVRLRDNILELDELSAENVIRTLDTTTRELFKRKRMRDFAYLDAEIDPPDWVILLISLAIISSYIGFLVYTHHQHAVYLRTRSRYNRFR